MISRTQCNRVCLIQRYQFPRGSNKSRDYKSLLRNTTTTTTRKFYNLGLTGKCWNILKDSYQEMSSVVNWCGKHSRSFIERQGVRQGGIISPTGYKIHIDPLLNLLQRMRVGLIIGTVYCGVPTVADDLLYLSRFNIELQAMLITKTKVFIFNSPLDTATWNQAGIFSITGKLIEVVEECTHLGIKRDSVSNTGH